VRINDLLYDKDENSKMLIQIFKKFEKSEGKFNLLDPTYVLRNIFNSSEQVKQMVLSTKHQSSYGEIEKEKVLNQLYNINSRSS